MLVFIDDLEFNFWPVWHYPRVDALEVFINNYFVVFKKPFLMAVGSYHWQPQHCLTEVWVYRRARYWVQPTQLPWSRYIEALGVKRGQEKCTEKAESLIGFSSQYKQALLFFISTGCNILWVFFFNLISVGTFFSLCYLGQLTCTK